MAEEGVAHSVVLRNAATQVTLELNVAQAVLCARELILHSYFLQVANTAQDFLRGELG